MTLSVFRHALDRPVLLRSTAAATPAQYPIASITLVKFFCRDIELQVITVQWLKLAGMRRNSVPRTAQNGYRSWVLNSPVSEVICVAVVKTEQCVVRPAIVHVIFLSFFLLSVVFSNYSQPDDHCRGLQSTDSCSLLHRVPVLPKLHFIHFMSQVVSGKS